MFTNKIFFYTAFILFIISIVLNFPFPHASPFGESIVSVLNIPIRTTQGLQVVGITSLALLIASLFFLSKSLKKYKGRFVLLTILLALFLPPFLADTYQQTFATGIYAISYDEETSECSFEMLNDKIMQVDCEFSFQNHSNDNVTFNIEFYETYLFEDDYKMVTLLNLIEPYEVTVKPKYPDTVKVETEIDVSEIKNHVTNGSASHINLTIRSDDKLRKL
jgi:hypothetical protein